jgi:hypothetical protein
MGIGDTNGSQMAVGPSSGWGAPGVHACVSLCCTGSMRMGGLLAGLHACSASLGIGDTNGSQMAVGPASGWGAPGMHACVSLRCMGSVHAGMSLAGLPSCSAALGIGDTNGSRMAVGPASGWGAPAMQLRDSRCCSSPRDSSVLVSPATYWESSMKCGGICVVALRENASVVCV